MGPVNRTQRVVRNIAVVLAYFGILSTAGAGQAIPGVTIEGRVANRPGGTPHRVGWVVWVDDITGEYPAPKAHAILDQKSMRFIPHILPILVGTTVDFLNSDSFLHNVFSISPAKQFNLGLYPTGRVPTILFDKPGIVAILCNVHPEMSAYIIVLKTPFFAVPGPDGHFIIRNVPSGNRLVRCWSEDGRIQERRVTLVAGTVQTVDF
jgi:plastocyanin